MHVQVHVSRSFPCIGPRTKPQRIRNKAWGYPGYVGVGDFLRRDRASFGSRVPSSDTLAVEAQNSPDLLLVEF